MKVIKILNEIYDKIMIIIFILLLLLSAYYMYDAWYVRYVSSGNNYLAYKPTLEDPEAYKELSDECIGWITVDNTTIDYPIMHTSDNVKYLNTNPYGEYSLAGSIFLDAKNHNDFTDPYNLLYGHHMSHYKMFGELDRFKDKEFFDSHKTGTLTVGSKQYKLEVFSFMEVDTNVKSLFDPSNYSNQLQIIQNQNIHYNNPKNSNKILALATCKDPGTTNRTMVFCSILE